MLGFPRAALGLAVLSWLLATRSLAAPSAADLDLAKAHFRTGELNYPYLTVKNGLKFKQKWAHFFAKENGPDDSTWSWAKIEMVKLDDVPEKLETIP